jgi:hypothetical protein
MSTVISIIHGARRPFTSQNISGQWIDELARHLQSHGVGEARAFHWPGGLGIDTLKRAIDDYCAHLADCIASVNRKDEETGEVHILAKSLGALIAERALLDLEYMGRGQPVCGTLLRVAPPDFRHAVAVSNVREVVDLTSDKDCLWRVGRFPALAFVYLFLRGGSTCGCRIERLKVSGIGHRQFNDKGAIALLGSEHVRIFDVYSDILLGGLGTRSKM